MSEASGERVVHFVTGASFSGIERQAINLIRAQRAEGCPAYLVCPPSATRLRAAARDAGIPIISELSRSSAGWLASLLRDAAKDPPRILHAHDGRSGPLAASLAFLSGGMFVRTQHFVQTASMSRGRLARRASLAAHRLVNQRLRGYVAVSRSVAAAGDARGDIGRAMLSVIPPAIELPDAATLSTAAQARAQQQTPVAAFVGRIQAERELDVFFRAMPAVLQEFPECRFLIAGVGPAEDDLRSLAASLGVSGAVTWLGWVPDSYVVLRQATVYVNTWSHEAFGMAAAEAMALGLPVVAADAGANVELVTDGVTGALFAAGDPDALTLALCRVLEAPAMAARLGDAARTRAVESFGAGTTARATLTFYDQLTAKQ